MKRNFLLFIIPLIVLFYSCKNKENETSEIQQNPINGILIEDIGYIVVNKDNIKYEIRNKEELKTILLILKKSHVEYVKFGAKNYFTVYSPNGEIIFTASFRGNRYKINGVVYKVEQNLFEY